MSATNPPPREPAAEPAAAAGGQPELSHDPMPAWEPGIGYGPATGGASAINGTATGAPASRPADNGPVTDEPATPQSRTIARGTKFRPALMWSYVVNFGGYAAVTLITLILAAILGPRQFGVLAMALVWVTLAQMLLQHGPTMAIIQHEEITDDHINAAFWSTLGGATVFGLGFAAAAPLWAAVNRLPELTAVCLALSPIVLLQALTVIPDAVLRRRLQLRGIAVRYIIAQLIAGLAAIGCALAGLGVWALVVQQVGSHGLYAVMLWGVTPWRPSLRPIGRHLRDIRGTSLKTLAGSLGTFASLRADVLVMSTLFGPVIVGLFRFAIRFPEMVADLTGRGLQAVALADLARHSEDRQALAARLRLLVHLGAVLSIPALGVLAGAATPLVLLIGDQWAEAAAPLRLLCLASAATLVMSMLGPALQAAQRPGLPAIMAWINAGLSITAILTAAVLTSGSSTIGRLLAVAAAMLIVQTVLAAGIGYLTFRRVLRVPAWPTVRSTLPSLLAAVVAAGVGTLVTGWLGAALAPIVGLLVVGTTASLAAGVLLLATDRQARVWLGQLVDRLRRLRAARQPVR